MNINVEPSVERKKIRARFPARTQLWSFNFPNNLICTNVSNRITPQTRGHSPPTSWAWSRPAGRDIAVELAAIPDEDDPVAGRVALVEFYLDVGQGNPRSVRDPPFAVGDDGDVVVAIGLERIRLEGVGLAAAGNPRMVGLPQAFEPFPDVRGRIRPLTVVARRRRHAER